MNVKKVQNGEIRVLQSDKEVLIEAVRSPDRIALLKAAARASAVLATPEVVDKLLDIVRHSKSEKSIIDAGKALLQVALPTNDKGTIPLPSSVKTSMTNEEIATLLEDSNES